MKIFRERALITLLLLAFCTGISSTAQAITIEPPPPEINVFEWMTSTITGQYGINIDSPDGYDWYVNWFAVENSLANSLWTGRPGWNVEFFKKKDFNNKIDEEFDWSGPDATMNVLHYFNDNGQDIGPNEYDDRFFWISQAPDSHFWVGLTFFPQPTNESPIELVLDGETRSPSPVPEPATLFLLGTGLAGIGAIRRKRANKT